uniref:carbonic anhydrase n=1 Tax=Odontella aurita TaxID=265563 RepID=A0A7S4J6K0_9STRA
MWISSPVPQDDPPKGYFNYDPDDKSFGPGRWGEISYSGPPPTPSPTVTPPDAKANNKNNDKNVNRVNPSPAPTYGGRGGLEYTPEYKRWIPVQEVVKADLTDNRCDPSNLDKSSQSPIDVSMVNIAGYEKNVRQGVVYHDLATNGDDVDGDGDIEEFETGVCYEHHEIRRREGDFQIRNGIVEKQILPNKLRLAYPYHENYELSPNPAADFPHNWGGKIDVRHVDISVPSQHLLEGKRYPAEYQIWHLHQKRRRSPVVSIFMDLHPDDTANPHLQMMLDEFQVVWQSSFFDCDDRRRRLLRAEADLYERVKMWLGGTNDDADEGGTSTILDEPQEYELEFRQRVAESRSNLRRAQASNAVWSPYDRTHIMSSIHFYGYTGSMTEPPCSEFVEYRIMDRPMLISRSQLFQIKFLIFNYKDPDTCERRSTHAEGRANRPIQTVQEKHRLYRCTCRDFLADSNTATRCEVEEEQVQLRETVDSYGA